MQKRIEQLIADGFTAEEAGAIAQTEAARARELLKTHKREHVIPTAQREVKFARLVAAKRTAGLSKEQAETVATEQCNHDERLQAAALLLKPANEEQKLLKAEAQARAKANAEVAAAMIEEIDPAPKTEAPKA